MRKLRVIYQDREAGILEESDEGYRFTYSQRWVDAGEDPISLTFPLRKEVWDRGPFLPSLTGSFRRDGSSTWECTIGNLIRETVLASWPPSAGIPLAQ